MAYPPLVSIMLLLYQNPDATTADDFSLKGVIRAAFITSSGLRLFHVMRILLGTCE